MRQLAPLLFALFALLPAVAYGVEIAQTLTADGTCERLVIDGADLSAQCGTALIQLIYEDGTVSLSVGTGGQSFFGLGEPERILAFNGPGSGAVWSDHAVTQVIAADDAGRSIVFLEQAVGYCTYEDHAVGMIIVCEATDRSGGRHALTYRTNGMPGFSF